MRWANTESPLPVLDVIRIFDLFGLVELSVLLFGRAGVSCAGRSGGMNTRVCAIENLCNLLEEQS
jgi:hypothetical protein